MIEYEVTEISFVTVHCGFKFHVSCSICYTQHILVIHVICIFVDIFEPKLQKKRDFQICPKYPLSINT